MSSSELRKYIHLIENNLNELHKPKELSDIRSHTGSWYDDIASFMGEFKLIGEGGRSRIFSHPSYPFLLKIFDEDDKSYFEYLAYCRTNADNPFCVRSKGVPVKIKDGIMAVRIEKLEPLNSQQFETLDMIWHNIEMRGHVGDTEGYESILGFDPKTDENFQEICEFIFDEDSYIQDLTANPGNVMRRGRQIVIIDPLLDFA